MKYIYRIFNDKTYAIGLIDQSYCNNGIRYKVLETNSRYITIDQFYVYVFVPHPEGCYSKYNSLEEINKIRTFQ